MSADKAFLEIDGRPLWQRQLSILEELSPKKIFIAGKELPVAEHEILRDAQPDSGPLAGLLAGLRACTTPLVLALAVDLPQMTAGYLRELLERCTAARGVVPTTDRFEPLAAVYPITALRIAEEQLARGELSLQRFVDRCLEVDLIARHPVAESEKALFLNLNTPADLARIR